MGVDRLEKLPKREVGERLSPKNFLRGTARLRRLLHGGGYEALPGRLLTPRSSLRAFFFSDEFLFGSLRPWRLAGEGVRKLPGLED